MANQAKGKVPRIRFKAYSEPWAVEMIGDVLAEKRRPIVLEDEKSYELITVKRRNDGVVSRGHLLGRDILVKNYAHLKAGDFVISKRQVVHGATGIVPPALDGAIVSNEYLTAVDSGKLLTEFFTIVASLPAMRKKFFLSSYGVDIEKLFFDADDWKKRSVMLPHTQEQDRIAKFFRKVDRVIGLHQHKHDKLVTLKKAMLQKIFPQPGSTTPKIRFKGFEGDWKINSLQSLVDRYDNLRVPVAAKSRVPGTTPYYGANGIQDYVHGYTHEGEFILVAEDGANDLKNYPVQYVSGKIWVNNHAHVLQGRDGLIDTRFLKYAFSQINVEMFLVGGGRAKLNAEAMMRMELYTPECITEQQKIGTYFRTLDTLITQHASQLQKLQQIKSACLEKMFA